MPPAEPIAPAQPGPAVGSDAATEPPAPPEAAASPHPAAPTEAAASPDPRAATEPVADAATVAAAASGELLDAHEPLLAPETEYELPPETLLAPDAGGDRAFVGGLEASVLEFGAARPSARVCQWCNAELPDAGAATCPSCGASLRSTQPDVEIPGLTTSAAATAGGPRLQIPSTGPTAPAVRGAGPLPAEQPLPEGTLPPVDLELDEETVHAAVQPPDSEVRRLMLEMELEQLRAEREGELGAREEPAT